MILIPEGVRYDKVNVQAEFEVVAAYYISVPDAWLYKERFLDLSELIYVTEGNLHLTVGGDAVSLSAGDAYLVRKYATLSGNRASEGACSFYTVSFHTTLDKHYDLYGRVIRIPSRSSYMETLFNNLSLFNPKDKAKGYLLEASLMLLLEVLSDAGSNEPERMQMNGIVSYINDHISYPLTVEDIAKHFHYSSDYIAKKFREQYGITLKRYITDKKLSVAKRLLTTSE